MELILGDNRKSALNSGTSHASDSTANNRIVQHWAAISAIVELFFCLVPKHLLDK